MIGLQEAAWIASMLGVGTTIIDKIYDRFFLQKTGRPPPDWAHPQRSAVIEDHSAARALVLTKHGVEHDKVTYEELAERLDPDDLRYLRTRERVMKLLYEQWEGGHVSLAMEVDPVRKVQVQQILDVKTDELGKELRAVLDFIANRCRLQLDDHYLAFRDLAGQ